MLCTSASYAIFHINLIQANRNIITSARITADSQLNVVTGGSGYSVLLNHGRPGSLQVNTLLRLLHTAHHLTDNIGIERAYNYVN